MNGHPSFPSEDIRPTADPCGTFLTGFRDCCNEAIKYLTCIEGIKENDPLVNGLRYHLVQRQESLTHGTAINSGISAFPEQLHSSVSVESYTDSIAKCLKTHDQNEGSFQGELNETSGTHTAVSISEAESNPEAHSEVKPFKLSVSPALKERRHNWILQTATTEFVDLVQHNASVANLANELSELLGDDTLEVD